MSTGADEIRGRIASVCAGPPFYFDQALEPFGFDRQPTTGIDQVFRLETEQSGVVGGLAFTEERTDLMRIWVARKQGGGAESTYRRLQADARSLRAAVVRDGLEAGGDYGVPDGGAVMIVHDPGTEYAVLRLSIPVNYEATL
ncbi:MAG: hypothetical protein AB7Q29_19600 [Vicinamibacterales bacterium]